MQTTDAWAWVQGPAGTSLVCRPLAHIAPHFFTTRLWSLGSPLADPDRAWNEAAEAAGVSTLVRVRQVHGHAVYRAGAPGATVDPSSVAADIIVSADAAVALAIQTADCVPLLIADAR